MKYIYLELLILASQIDVLMSTKSILEINNIVGEKVLKF